MTSRYKPYTPSYDLMQRKGKAGYMVGESKYRAEFGGSGAARSVVDVRGFPSLLHLQTRGPWKGHFLPCLSCKLLCFIRKGILLK